MALLYPHYKYRPFLGHGKDPSKLFTGQPGAGTALATDVAVGALRERNAEGVEGTNQTDRTPLLTHPIQSSAADLTLTYGHKQN